MNIIAQGKHNQELSVLLSTVHKSLSGTWFNFYLIENPQTAV